MNYKEGAEMKRLTITFLFLAVGINVYAQAFAWDIKFLKEDSQESVPVSQIIRMNTGDKFEFSILSDINVFCYVVLYDSQRQVFVLSNQQLTGKETVNFGPFMLTEPVGTETIYVIMSTERQRNLETSIRNFSNSGSRQNANNVHREVVSLQNRASRLGEPASSYIPSGGTTRSASLQHITRFSGKNLYVRAITIRH